MNKDEMLKQIVDTFGELSFLLETAVKLHQTGQHTQIKISCMVEVRKLADKLVEQIDELQPINVNTI